MLTRILKVVVLIVLLLFLAYAGMCVYGNIVGSKTPGQVETPKIEDAQYTVNIANTGGVVFTDSYEEFGRVYILHGYWELAGQEFRYHKGDLALDTEIFGKITITRRTPKP